MAGTLGNTAPAVGASGSLSSMLFLVSGQLGTRSFFPTDFEAQCSGPGHPWQGGPSNFNPYSLAKQTDLPLIEWRALGGRMVNFELHHSSQAFASNPALGPKWTHSGDMTLLIYVKTLPRRAALIMGNHRIQKFVLNGANWNSTDGYRDVLAPFGGAFKVTTQNQVEYRFELTTQSVASVRKYRLASIVDAVGNTTNYSYDPLGRLIQIQDPTTRKLLFSYSAGGKLIDLTFAVAGGAMRTWNFQYDPNGRLIKVLWPPVTTDSGVQNYVTEFGYSIYNNISEVIDCEGNKSLYTYIGDRLASERWPANSPAELVQFDFVSPLIRRITNALGGDTYYEYDPMGRLTTVTDPLGNSWMREYNDPDFLWHASLLTVPGGDAYSWDLDNKGRCVNRRDPSGERWDYAYDARNNLIQILEPLVTDAWGFVQPGRHCTVFAYNAANQLIAAQEYTDPITPLITTFAYDAWGNLVSVLDPAGHRTTYNYDPHGNLVQASTPLGLLRQYHYDNAQLTAGFTVPNAWTDATSVRTELVRDEWGRLRRSDFTTQPDIEYRYDGMSRLVRVADGTPDVTLFSYDANGRLVREEVGPSYVDYTYDANGRRVSMTHDSFTGIVNVSYVYDPCGRLVSMNDMGSVSNYQYDPLGRLVQQQLGNGASTMYSYASGRLRSIMHHDVGMSIFVQEQYQYQADGRLSRRTSGPDITSYGYDYLNRLVREEHIGANPYMYSYSYDADGLRTQQIRNGVSTNYIHDGDHKLVQSLPQGMAPETYQYDGNGRLARRTRNNGTQAYRFTYDRQGLMTLAELYNPGMGVFEPNREYMYDGLSRRVRRTEFVGGGPTVEEKYLFETELISLSLVSCQPIRIDTLTMGNPSVSVMTWMNGLTRIQNLMGFDRWPATDALGDVRASTDMVGSQTGQTTDFNAFGEIVASSGLTTRFQFGADLGILSEKDAELTSWIGGWGFFYDPKIGESLPGGLAYSDMMSDGGGWTSVVDRSVPEGAMIFNQGIGASRQNNVVDGADFLVWRMGSSAALFNIADYTVWRINLHQIHQPCIGMKRADYCSNAWAVDSFFDVFVDVDLTLPRSPRSSVPILPYHCNMTTDGGGWTALMQAGPTVFDIPTPSTKLR